ncbi:hypothetical protein GHT06_018325 [Daphnia sinensis]|uniref:Uncharacterized protein n=1 Tax=Daphnia sinensis TaxID=1820382 RepID=A0AAD5PT23_9CRUS|nr:hypothetical protein GHT06_018325 [Daphnia sinensis]
MCLACCAACMCCGKLTKWIIIGVIIFFVVTAVIVPCVLLLGPEEPESTTLEPLVTDLYKSKVLDTDFNLQNSIIFKSIDDHIKSTTL